MLNTPSESLNSKEKPKRMDYVIMNDNGRVERRIPTVKLKAIYKGVETTIKDGPVFLQFEGIRFTVPQKKMPEMDPRNSNLNLGELSIGDQYEIIKSTETGVCGDGILSVQKLNRHGEPEGKRWTLDQAEKRKRYEMRGIRRGYSEKLSDKSSQGDHSGSYEAEVPFGA